MGCTRSRSKILVERLSFFAVLFALVCFPSPLWAAFASQFSFSTGEEYNDNIFFSKNKEHDFITVFTPTLTLLYAPEGQVTPTFSAEISPSYQLYARHSDLNNFDNVSANAGYTYRYSPILDFYLSDSFQSQGKTRTENFSIANDLLAGSASIPPVGRVVPPPISQNVTRLISSGKEVTNFVALGASYLYRPNIGFIGGYTNELTSYIDAGGKDVFHTINARGVYNWRQDHNLHAGYKLSIFDLRNGGSGTVHEFGIGDDYFTNYTLQLTPTLSLAASSGLSINTGNTGPRVANNTSITITKLWETAQLNGGLRKGLTPSYGVSGISDTTSFFTKFNWRITEKLSANSYAIFSLFDTDDVNYKTFQAGLGFQYLFTTWLSSGLNYAFNWLDSGAGANKTDLLEKGTVKSNIVFLSLTARFDVWPNIGLARSMSSSTSTLSPVWTPFVRQPPQSVP